MANTGSDQGKPAGSPLDLSAPVRSGSKGLTRRQKEAIPFLIGGTLEEGRKKAKVGKATLFGWMAEEGFRNALDAARNAFIEQAMERLKGGVLEAIENILQLTHDENPWVRLRASEKILDCYIRLKEIEEIENRLASIETIVFEKRTYRL